MQASKADSFFIDYLANALLVPRSSAWTDKIGSKSKALRRGVLEFEAVFEIFIVPANDVMIDTDFLRLGSQGVRPHKWRKKRLVFR
jgi:hypothetical protein